MTQQEKFLILVVSLISLYIVGGIFIYFQTNKKVNDRRLVLLPEEAQMLMGMIVAYPLFYPEIEIILKHADKVKVESYDLGVQ